MFATFRDEAWQVKQATGMWFVGRGKVEADFARWAEFLVSHRGEEKKIVWEVKLWKIPN